MVYESEKPAVVFFVGMIRGYLKAFDLIFIIVPSLLIMVIGFTFKKVENRVRNIPASDEELSRQRDAIVTTWMKKPFPDW